MELDIATQLFGKIQLDEKRALALAEGVKVSDIPAGTLGKHSLNGKRGRAATKGAKASYRPTQFSDSDFGRR